MRVQRIELSKECGLKTGAFVDAYLHEGHADVPQKIRPALIVAPGGGYAFVSGRENEEVALEFFTREYNVFALTYTIAPNGRYPMQLTEIAATVDYVKKHAEELFVDKNRIFGVGFSAGGHLMGSLLNAAEIPGHPEYDFRLAGGALSYPVINVKAGHNDSFKNLLGEDWLCQKPEHAWLNLDESVSDKNPPAFIWSTSDDKTVPCVNALLYAAAYAERGLKFELHVFKSGAHGLSLGDERTSCGQGDMDVEDVTIWTEYADRFFRSIN